MDTARILIGVLSVLFATPALSLPAPMSDQEMLAKSDLVALVRIWSVTCTGMTKDERGGKDLPSYAAKAELIEVIKGEERKGDDVTITFDAVPPQATGKWSVFYYPGEMVFTHLVHNGARYTSIAPNARGDIVQPALINDLPTTPGKTVGLRREPRQTIEH